MIRRGEVGMLGGHHIVRFGMGIRKLLQGKVLKSGCVVISSEWY
jgi:hypothetical protein